MSMDERACPLCSWSFRAADQEIAPYLEILSWGQPEKEDLSSRRFASMPSHSDSRCPKSVLNQRNRSLCARTAATNQYIDHREHLQQISSGHLRKEARGARNARGLIMNGSSFSRNGCSGGRVFFCPK